MGKKKNKNKNKNINKKKILVGMYRKILYKNLNKEIIFLIYNLI